MQKRNNTESVKDCPCGSDKNYTSCCEPLHRGQPAGSAEALMRSRYSANVLGLHEYLQRSWHASTRPAQIGAENSAVEPTRWLGLQIKRCEILDTTHASVEFVARYKIGGRAVRLHEISRFVQADGHWFYLDGQFPQ